MAAVACLMDCIGNYCIFLGRALNQIIIILSCRQSQVWGTKFLKATGTVLLKSKLPRSCETCLISLKTCLNWNETCLVSPKCTGSTNTSHSNLQQLCRIIAVLRHDFHSHHRCVCITCVLQELLFASARWQLLAASCGHFLLDPTRHNNFFAVGS